MSDPRPAPARARIWMVLALALAGLGSLSVFLARPAPQEQVLILASRLDSEGQDVGPGLEVLLSDLVEVLTGATVTHARVLPAQPELKRLPPQTRLLRFQGAREKDHLVLTVEWNTVAHVLAGQAWNRDVLPAQEPRSALERVARSWPLATQLRHLNDLLPTTPSHFWQLLEGLSIQDDERASRHLDASQQLAEEEPRCATAWTALGDHLYRSLWVAPQQAGVGLNSRTHHAFQKAFHLIPGYPRATFLWSMMLTDTGNQDHALKALVEAIRLRPGMPDLYLGVAYAGRTSGLLDIAQKALARREELLGSAAAPSTWLAETTHLYRGDLRAFGQELARATALRQDASILFYRGYFALLQGRREEAFGFMAVGSDPAMTPAPFRDLCRAYRAYLEGRFEEGLAELHEIDEVRGKLHIPDGEWTFKEAEVYALLGDADRSVDCATRAFVQGFSCADWYEKSPFLKRTRQHPRWPMLRRNIRERQATLEGSFPPSSLDL